MSAAFGGFREQRLCFADMNRRSIADSPPLQTQGLEPSVPHVQRRRPRRALLQRAGRQADVGVAARARGEGAALRMCAGAGAVADYAADVQAIPTLLAGWPEVQMPGRQVGLITLSRGRGVCRTAGRSSASGC